MECENLFCIYEEEGRCLLPKIQMDEQGRCRECISIELEKALLVQIKKDIREKLR